jgi:periplasmic protein TonB
MSRVSGQLSNDNFGVLKGCLVEGDPEQQKRQRRVRRRSLVLSIALQGAILAAIVLVPLLGKPARIALANVTPVPPYYSRPMQQHTVASQPPAPAPRHETYFQLNSIPVTVVTHEAPQDPGGDQVPFAGAGIDVPGAIPLVGSRTPAEPTLPPHVETPHVVHVTQIDPAMLTHRVEPVYPPLARQTGRSGRVELRAIIGMDGTVQSLEAVGGDPMFYQSAMEAVRQWRYTPTLLNGQRVEVDTHITVVYTMQR